MLKNIHYFMLKYRVFATIFNIFAEDKCFSVSIQGYYLVLLRGTTLHVSQRAPVFHCYKTIIELYVTSTSTRFTCRISFIVCYCFQYDYEDNYNTHLRGESETLSD